MSLNDLSLSERKGAVLMELLWACVLSGYSGIFSVGDSSRGLGSSRIDLVLERRLKGLGLFFRRAFELEDGEDSVVDSIEA